jgi:hypothetical protein
MARVGRRGLRVRIDDSRKLPVQSEQELQIDRGNLEVELLPSQLAENQK